MRKTNRKYAHLLGLVLVLSTCSHAGCYQSSMRPGVNRDASDPMEGRPDVPLDIEEGFDDIPVEIPVDPPVEEVVPCPPDDPPGHIYIDVDGTVMPLDMTTPVTGTFTGAISPLDALVNPSPTPIGSSSVSAVGAFSMVCMDVGPVVLGLVILHDDDPADPSNLFYPTGTMVRDWSTAEERVDVTGAAVFAVSQSLAAAIMIMASVDIDADGLAMGIVVDGTTGAPLDGAAIVRLGGDALDVVYPAPDFSGMETDGNTSVSGVFIIAQPVLPLISDVTAVVPGYTFEQGSMATRAEFIFFVVFAGAAG
jgi:hypothetical protein